MSESAPTFRILGDLAVVHDGTPVVVGGRRRRTLLAYLLVNVGRPVPIDSIEDSVWDGVPPPGARSTARTYISQFRKLPRLRIDAEPSGYRTLLEDSELDALLVRTLLASARAETDPGHRLRLLDRAFALWRGPALEEFSDAHWAIVEAQRLRAIHDEIRNERFDSLIALGRQSECRGELDAAVGEEPLDERLRVLHARALHGSGATAEALRTLAELRRKLGEALGISPGAEVVALERRLLEPSRQLDPGTGSVGSDHISVSPAGEEGASPTGQSPLPDGTVTFLFIDMQGSTALVKHLGDEAYADVLGVFRERLTYAIVGHGGVIFGMEGDAVFAVFDSPSNAVAAAFAAQHRLAEDIDSVHVRARMGLHTGEALVVGDDYVGTTVHVAARVAAAAHGGQVVASDSCRILAPDADWIDLGMHRLKDVDRLQHLHQLRIDDSEFPPLATAENVPTNLPSRLDSFVGREADITRLTELVHASRMTTLAGPGGVGKTRLAVEAAWRLRAVHPGGVHMIELARVLPGGDVPAAFTRTLAEAGARGSDLRAVVADAVDGLPTLFVVDNCEHVHAEAAGFVADLLAWEPTVRVLATSREPLHLRGEHVHRVGSLSTDRTPADGRSPAEQLFVDRAEAATGRVVDDGDDATIRRICSELDGLPLAIELAAARSTSLAPVDIARRLEDRFALLRDTGAADEARHRTLRAVVDWSYELLTPIDRLVFNRLAIFGEPFTLEAAETVTSDGEVPADYVLDGVAHLVDKSLVQLTSSADRPAYRMLDTLRDYGRARLVETGRLAAGEEAFLRWAMQVTSGLERDMRTPRQDAALHAALPHAGNLRHAMEMLLARGREVDALRVVASAPVDVAAERVRVIDQLLTVVDAGEHPDAVGRAHFAAANCELERGGFEPMLRHARAAGSVFEAIGDDRLVAWSAFMSVFGAWGTGDVEAARRAVQIAQESFARLDDLNGMANASWVAIMLEPDLDRAVEQGAWAETQLRQQDSPFALAHCLEAVALAEIRADRSDHAAPRLAEALQIAAELRVSGCAAHCLEAVAACVASVAEPPSYPAIAELLGAAEELRVATGHRHRPWELDGHRAALSILRSALPDEELDAAVTRGRGHRLSSATDLGGRALQNYFPDVDPHGRFPL